MRRLDADAHEYGVEVVGYETIPRALRKEGDKNQEEETLSVTGSLEEETPALLCSNLFLVSDCFVDLSQFVLDEGIVRISVGMILNGRTRILA